MAGALLNFNPIKMTLNFIGTSPLFAQGDGGLMNLLLLIGPILFIFWFFLIRPQQREDDRRRKMLESLKKNDKVYTVGGIIGVVHNVDLEKKEVVLKLDDSNNTKVKFLLNAIAAIVVEPETNEK